jgi:hypothetical protein
MDKNIAGGATALFSGVNNQLGTSGMCVNLEELPSASGLQEPQAFGCPIPCNPTWGEGDIVTVCGSNRVCCQTVELEPEDCVLDAGTWRPVSGADIPALSEWRPGQHETHQDPGGQGCQTFAGQAGGSQYLDCVAQLSVADQRGYCMRLEPDQQCPTRQEMYVDACAALNQGVPPPG